MISTLFLDTETTGIPKNYNAPPVDWPRLVQVGYLSPQSYKEYIVEPEGFEIPLTATEVHGISHYNAKANGVPLINVMTQLAIVVSQSQILVGHNLKFDLNVLSGEYLRLGLRPPFEGMTTCDTMIVGVGVCKIPGLYGYKWPKLTELYEALFGHPLEQTHTALNDILATARCFYAMVDRGIIKITP